MSVMYKMVHNALCCIIFELIFNICKYSVPYNKATTVKIPMSQTNYLLSHL